jgi:hypothetical protein
MGDVNALAVAAAVIVAFLVSTVWYSVFAGPLGMEADAGRPPLWKIAVELTRSLTLSIVLAVLCDRLGIVGWRDAIGLGLLLWAGFPAVLLSGSVLWERVPWRRAALHTGDWLLKLVVVTAIVGLWR